MVYIVTWLGMEPVVAEYVLTEGNVRIHKPVTTFVSLGCLLKNAKDLIVAASAPSRKLSELCRGASAVFPLGTATQRRGYTSVCACRRHSPCRDHRSQLQQNP